MIDYVLYGILYIEYLVQQIVLFSFISNFLDVKNKKVYYFSSIPLSIFGFACDCIKYLTTNFTGTEIVIVYKTIITIGVGIILTIFLTKGKLMKKIFTLFLAHGIIFFLDGISSQLTLQPIVMLEYQNTPINIKVLGNTYFTFLFIAITFLLSKVIKKKIGNYNNKQLLILSFFFIAQFSLCILATHNINTVTDTFSVSIFIVSLITIIADITIANLIGEAGEKGRLEEQLKCIDEIQKGEKDYYENLAEKEEMMSKIRHDWNEQLQTALTLCADDSEKAFKAKQIISELNESLLKSVPKRFTQNITLNALLNSKSKILEDADIKYKFDVQLKEKINIDLINLCSIFSNLINNAYEYSIKNIDNDNFIDLKAKQIDNKIIIKCTNSLKKEDEIIQKNDFKTTKADRKNHGYGLVIIKSLTEKYNGNMHIDIENNQFVANLYILENNLI